MEIGYGYRLCGPLGDSGMKKIAPMFILLFASQFASASIEYITVTECRPFLGFRFDDKEVQEKVNEKLKAALNAANAKTIFFIKYGNDESGFRDKSNACIIATAWFSK